MNNNPTQGADALRHAAYLRLFKDGADSTHAMQRRVMLLAAERNLPPSDFHKLMYKRPSSEAVMSQL